MAIARSIYELMDAELIHRDLQYDNIIFQAAGNENLHATFLDIDSLADVNGKNVDRDIYQGNGLIMAPEVAGHGISKSSDLFSLGVLTLISFFGNEARELIGIATATEMKSGPIERFYTRGTRPKTVQQALLNLKDSYPEEVRDIVHGLLIFLIESLQPSPKDRPKTMEEVKDLLSSRPNLEI